jgi:hypothetical protein
MSDLEGRRRTKPMEPRSQTNPRAPGTIPFGPAGGRMASITLARRSVHTHLRGADKPVGDGSAVVSLPGSAAKDDNEHGVGSRGPGAWVSGGPVRRVLEEGCRDAGFAGQRADRRL